MYVLRNYQTDTINQILASLKKGNQSILVQSPPRTGKTVIMAEVARRATLRGNRIMFIVHRKEIVDQVRETFKKNNVNMNLTEIGMVQTFTRRVEKLIEPAIIFVDEAHHVLAKSYLKILNAFPKAIKLLFTATPVRLNGQGFEEVATDLIPGKQISDLIEQGFLAPVDYFAPPDIDLKILKLKRTGDFDEKSIEKALKPKIYGNTVKQYLKLAKGKQAIAYTYNVSSAEKLAKQFNEAGITSKAISGQTKAPIREKAIQDYKEGKIKIIVNAELFTEGLDLPGVDCVIMLRPTQSLSLYLQFAMRSMNPAPGKRAIIIDQVGNVNRFGLPTQDRIWTLEGEKRKVNKRSTDGIKSVTTCAKCFATFYRNGNKCPFCNNNLIEEKTIEVVDDAQLEKVISKRKEIFKQIVSDKVANNVANKKINELNSYAEVKAYAKLKNYKPGWVYFYSKKRGFIK